MSTNARKSLPPNLKRQAPVFAALGDETRLSLLSQLGADGLSSISQLSAGRSQTRQAIRKHLLVLEQAQLVRSVRRGRENQFQVDFDTVIAAGQSLQAISDQWGQALSRLKQLAERDSGRRSSD